MPDVRFIACALIPSWSAMTGLIGCSAAESTR
jgi:hypothetical protein